MNFPQVRDVNEKMSKYRKLYKIPDPIFPIAYSEFKLEVSFCIDFNDNDEFTSLHMAWQLL